MKKSKLHNIAMRKNELFDILIERYITKPINAEVTVESIKSVLYLKVDIHDYQTNRNYIIIEKTINAVIRRLERLGY